MILYLSSKIPKTKPQNLAVLRFFGRGARSQVNILNYQKQKGVFPFKILTDSFCFSRILYHNSFRTCNMLSYFSRKQQLFSLIAILRYILKQLRLIPFFGIKSRTIPQIPAYFPQSLPLQRYVFYRLQVLPLKYAPVRNM